MPNPTSGVPNATPTQEPFEVAVVVPTVLRPTLLRAIRSIYRQRPQRRIQILIGIDKQIGAPDCLETLLRERPANAAVTILDLGYSTSIRHGGLYPNRFSGALRTILSYAANSRYVAYLDDDDWWGRDHLSGLLSAIAGKDWAFSYRWLVDQSTEWPICEDEWDSVGPGRGINQQRFGGFVVPSCLLLDKKACHFIFPLWALSPFTDGTGEDRLVFKELLRRPWASSGKHSCFYEMRADVLAHEHHAKEFLARNIHWIHDRSIVDDVLKLLREAETAFRAGATEAAIAKCQKLLSLNPNHARCLHLQALAEWQSGNRASALLTIDRAVAVGDGDDAILACCEKMNNATGNCNVAEQEASPQA